MLRGSPFDGYLRGSVGVVGVVTATVAVLP